MTNDERLVLLEQWYGDAQPASIREAVNQYNPVTLIEQIKWWERTCEAQRERARRAEKNLGCWQCLALAELLVLLAVAGASLLYR